jgi:hypothetical protein
LATTILNYAARENLQTMPRPARTFAHQAKTTGERPARKAAFAGAAMHHAPIGLAVITGGGLAPLVNSRSKTAA